MMLAILPISRRFPEKVLIRARITAEFPFSIPGRSSITAGTLEKRLDAATVTAANPAGDERSMPHAPSAARPLAAVPEPIRVSVTTNRPMNNSKRFQSTS